MRKIAALIDTDSRLEAILEAAFIMSEQHNAELIIYHFLPKEETVTLENTKILIGTTNLSDLCKAHSTAYSVYHRIVISTGNFKVSISDLVKSENIDLIIMGSNGVSSSAERFFGSHAERIIENITCSVLVIKDIELPHSINEVVFASSFNEMDKEVIQYFLKFMKLSKDTVVHLLMIDTHSFFNQPSTMVKKTFEEFSVITRPYTTKTHFYHGISLEESIKRFVEEENPDLLVMSNKYSRLMRSVFSSGSKMVATLHENQYPFLAIDYDVENKED